MTALFATVAWLNIETQAGTCPRHTMPTEARDPELMGLVPVDANRAQGKACTECGAPLAGDPREGARVLMQEWCVEDGRDARLVEEERDGDWLADDARMDGKCL
jgi:hypothetical protein